MGDAFDHLGPLGDFGEEDLRSWAVAGSAARRFDDALHAAQRARFLSMAIGSSFGAAVEAGLAAADVAATLALASTEVRDRAQSEAKRVALREHASAGASTILGAMVRAALAHDGRALASGVGATRATSARRARTCLDQGGAAPVQVPAPAFALGVGSARRRR